MALRNKFLSPTCAPDLVDIDTYFFFEKIFRSDTRMRVTIASFLGVFCPHLNFGGQKRPNPNPPTKYCGSAAVVRCGGRVGDIWGAAPRFGPRSSSRTAIPSCFCPELGGHLPRLLVIARRTFQRKIGGLRFFFAEEPAHCCVSSSPFFLEWACGFASPIKKMGVLLRQPSRKNSVLKPTSSRHGDGGPKRGN